MHNAQYLRAHAEFCLEVARQMSDHKIVENLQAEAARYYAEADEVEAEHHSALTGIDPSLAGVHSHRSKKQMVTDTEQRTNRLLTLLSDDDYRRLRPHLSISKLDYKKVLYEARREIRYVYFPIDGVASLVLEMGDSGVEVGTIGNEGMVGLPLVLGDRQAPSTVYVQVPGQALRIDARVFREEFNRSPTLNAVALRYIHAFFNQVAQSAACAHLHKVEQRCCRWLLMTRDRMPSDEFLLTQEFLGMMLGVRRPSVSLTMEDLQKARLVKYSRGRVKILDGKGLQKRACECYQISKHEFDRLLGDTPSKTRTDRVHRLVSEIGYM